MIKVGAQFQICQSSREKEEEKEGHLPADGHFFHGD